MSQDRFLPITNSVAWSTGANWSTAAVPVTGDDAILTSGSPDIDTGTLDYSNTTLNSFTVANTFTGTLGEAPSGTSLGADFKINFARMAVSMPLGVQDGFQGTGRMRVASTSSALVTVYDTSSSLDSSYGLEAFRWKNTAATGSQLVVNNGSVGFGTDGTGSYYLDALTVNAGAVGVGPTSTLISVVQNDGTLNIQGDINATGSILQTGGAATLSTIKNIATLSLNGTVTLNGRPPPKVVSGITRSSSTATATSASHGYANGDYICITGAVQTEYNGVFAISNVATNTFDYTVANSPTTPATTATAFACFRSIATTIQVQNNGTLDLSQAPQAIAVVNPIQLLSGATVICASPTQISTGGSAPSRPRQFTYIGCGVEDVTIRMGRGVSGSFGT